MQKKLLVSLGLISLIGFTSQVYANSTIYTDDLGRLHFLGKDPGAKTLQKIEDYDNPQQKDLTNVMFKNEQPKEVNQEAAKAVEGDESAPAAKSETPVANTTKGHTNKSKGTYTFNKGAMDASDPYTFGNTNVEAPKNDAADLENLSKKRFWQIW